MSREETELDTLYGPQRSATLHAGKKAPAVLGFSLLRTAAMEPDAERREELKALRDKYMQDIAPQRSPAVNAGKTVTIDRCNIWGFGPQRSPTVSAGKSRSAGRRTRFAPGHRNGARR
ncbi:hypothetical protein [Virgisporangium aliadipatigenens]|uniref:hypothetical protein n=1 Tax=Virgisporangium aliadipatigenens TaxID=741659 RepID=UPI004032AA9E